MIGSGDGTISRTTITKKISFKSLERALDLFSPAHGHYSPPDPESKKIQISYKMHAEYGVVKNLNQSGEKVISAMQDKITSEILALLGPEGSGDVQNGAQNALVMPPPLQPRGP